MPVNGSNRPPWLKDRLESVNKNVPPAWARKNPTTTTAASSADTKDSKPSTKGESSASKTAPIVKKPTAAALAAAAAAKENGEPPKTTVKLQSKEIKVPVVVQQKKPVQPPLTKPGPMLKNTTPQMTVLREPAKPKPKPKEPSPESESEEEEEEVEEEEEEEEEEEGSTEYETETESEEDSPPPPPVKKPEPKREPSPPKPKTPIQLKKVSKSPEKTDTDSKSSTKSEKSSSPEPKTFVKPPLKKVVRPQQDERKERSPSPEPKGFRVQLRKVPSNLKAPRLKEKLPEVQLKRVEKPLLEEIPKKEEAYPHKPSMLKSESSKRIPPPPPMPKSNIPPPPPPPPKLGPPAEFKKDDISDKQKEVIEKLKKRPRRRPDWSDMMKEVEQGKKLRHVECNDRSKPIVHCKSITKVKDQFIFETEKATAHNVLLKEIQSGVRLKPTKCNDRSKPILQGLRKFRRQMTLEEQLAKSESRANLEAPPPDEEEVDEMDDIDKVRDDLQSTKQLLAMELRNNEALERENKRLLQRVQNLEGELSRERWNPMSGEEKSSISGPDAELIQSLKKEAVEAQQQSKQLEEKYQTVAKELDVASKLSEEQKRKIGELEKKLQCLTDDDFYLKEHQGITDNVPRRTNEAANQKESSPELAPEEEEEEEEEEDEEKKAEKVAKRLNREVNMLAARLIRLKEKEEEKHAERHALKYAMKTNQYALKNEHKKYKQLQKEVDKMAAMMKMEDEDEDGEEPKEAPPEEPEAEEEEEEESEEESESESESESDNESVNEAEDAPDEKKKVNLEPRVKRHENRLASLKKGNYFLQANVDRIKDEINKTREMCCTLQADLDSVIADLG